MKTHKEWLLDSLLRQADVIEKIMDETDPRFRGDVATSLVTHLAREIRETVEQITGVSNE